VVSKDAVVLGQRVRRSEKISAIEAESRHRSAQREELAWVRDAQRGSEQAVEALFRRHWRPAYRAAYLIVRDAAAAEDIAQEAFLSALRALQRFDRRRSFAPWLHRIVVNRAIDWSRARVLRREVPESVALPTAPPQDRVDDPRFGDLDQAVGSLPPEQRAVVVMRYLLEYTPGEIAKMLELPRGTVNSRLRRGLDSLAELLGVEVP
jgi:RNA polymerase sigma-70 factor (ECF subfamily)